jgi:hypothetical protein
MRNDSQPAVLFDNDNPDSVLNKLSDSMRAKIYRLSKDQPDLFQLPEADLKKRCRPTESMNRIRLSFWLEYDASCSSRRNMGMDRVYAGCVTKEYFYGKFMDTAECVAWMLCPPVAFEKSLMETISTGHARLREVLDAPLMDGKGQVNIKLAELMLKIVIASENRLMGTVVSRQQHLHNIQPPQIGETAVSVSNHDMAMGVDDIDERLKKIAWLKTQVEKQGKEVESGDIIDASTT